VSEPIERGQVPRQALAGRAGRRDRD